MEGLVGRLVFVLCAYRSQACCVRAEKLREGDNAGPLARVFLMQAPSKASRPW